ncbi:MAG: hypothetical protein KF802_07870 [Bdellovibrionaceae bacterium]|nr:hypothetical protein [Pseudobdellovibrionaceae bacterium]MBX3034509.1 hypothetical protein [Pseudobdellovibrionaceae bacterium]
MNALRVAATQFDLKALHRPEDFWDRCEVLAAQAARDNAKMIVFPEYFTLSWLIAHEGPVFEKALEGFAAHEDEFHRELKALSNGLHMGITAGTAPVRVGDHIVNRCHVFLPDGRLFTQDKQRMTAVELNEWSIAPGDGQTAIFDFEGARWGLAIGEDVEFPSLTAPLLDHDVDFILVPSRAEDLHSYWRVRHCSQARAVEGQCGVVMSSIVGGDKRHPEILKHHGRAGFFTPCDQNMPQEGVLGLGELNKENIHVAQYDLLAIHQIRAVGATAARQENLMDL